jgi:hypothetical protein
MDEDTRPGAAGASCMVLGRGCVSVGEIRMQEQEKCSRELVAAGLVHLCARPSTVMKENRCCCVLA